MFVFRRCANGIDQRGGAAHGLEHAADPRGYGGGAGSGRHAGENATVQMALLMRMFHRRGQPEHVLLRNAGADLVEIGKQSHGSKSQHPLHVRGNVDAGVKIVGNQRRCQGKDESREQHDERVAVDFFAVGVQRSDGRSGQIDRSRRRIIDGQVAVLLVHGSKAGLQAGNIRGQIVGALQARGGAAGGAGQLRKLRIQAVFNARRALEIGLQLLLNLLGGLGAQVLAHGIERNVDLGQFLRILLVERVLGSEVGHLRNQVGAALVERRLHADEPGIGRDNFIRGCVQRG